MASRGLNGAHLLDDSYNANPTSLAAGIALLCQHRGRKWLVMGDMAELGNDAEEMHLKSGVDAAAAGVERLFTVGKLARFASVGFGEGARHFSSVEDLSSAIAGQLEADVMVLVKGSRSARMEDVINLIKAVETDGGLH